MIFWKNYFLHLKGVEQGSLQVRTIRLLLMLMLARVDGKSPVEYLKKRHYNWIRSFFKGNIYKDYQGDFKEFLRAFEKERLNG